MKILCIHGIGNQDARTDWQDKWKECVTAGIHTWNPGAPLDFHFTKYDELFAAAPLNVGTVLESLARLSASGLFHGIVDMFRNSRGFGDTIEDVRWTAGMVAQWTANEELRAALRKRITRDILQFEPDLILAHSLGSLAVYDTLRQNESTGGSLSTERTVVTFGSQIGNPAVRQVFGGRIEGLRKCKWWWNLFNEEDDVFTTSLVPASRDRFQQVDTEFDIEGMADHDGVYYLSHEKTSLSVWQTFGAGPRALAALPRLSRAAARPMRPRTAAKRKQTRPVTRALLVGIGDYPDPRDVLRGPVNDVFLMSSVLQELDFDPDSIRVVLNERATTAAIRERIAWLLADARAGDRLFFYFAGHGTQIPGYGRDAEVDRIDECLVPYDFDWRNDNAITDDEFMECYSQLPYDVEFMAVLDCCHAGGMTRAAGSGVRGLTPPDDIRHRAIKWDKDEQMWVPRERLAPEKNPGSSRVSRRAETTKWLGENGVTKRLGRATPLWLEDSRAYDRARKAYGHHGPYTPVVLEACDESELAYEYHHGNTVHGAFTYSLCQEMRDAARMTGKSGLTFQGLLKRVRERIPKVVAKPQTPQLLCPKHRLRHAVPGLEKRAGR